MDDYGQARPVRRSELRSPSASPEAVSTDEELRLQWRQQLGQAYDKSFERLPPSGPIAAHPHVTGPSPDHSDEGAYDFRLFSSKPQTSQIPAAEVKKVRIGSPVAASQEPGFVRPRKSDQYYFAGIEGNDNHKRYEESAMEGERVLMEAKTRWPGFGVPWRVTTITMSRSRTKAVSIVPRLSIPGSGKRKRSGKKRRIAIRIRNRAKDEREARSKKAEIDKETLEREKRNRRNREKKVKRREKARAQKKGGPD